MHMDGAWRGVDLLMSDLMKADQPAQLRTGETGTHHLCAQKEENRIKQDEITGTPMLSLRLLSTQSNVFNIGH